MINYEIIIIQCTAHNLLQIYKQYSCSYRWPFVVLYETRYDQHNHLWYYRPFILKTRSL